jgi:hypothetical protein
VSAEDLSSVHEAEAAKMAAKNAETASPTTPEPPLDTPRADDALHPDESEAGDASAPLGDNALEEIHIDEPKTESGEELTDPTHIDAEPAGPSLSPVEEPAADDAENAIPTPELSPLAEKVSERATEAGKKISDTASEEAHKRMSKIPKDRREAWLRAHPGESALVTAYEFTHITPGLEVSIPGQAEKGVNLAEGGKALKVVVEGRQRNLTRLLGRSEDGSTFQCREKVVEKGKNSSGDDIMIEKEVEVNVPVSDLIDAHIADTQAAIKAVLPIHQQTFFGIYGEILTAKATGELNPLATKSDMDLTDLESLIKEADRPETSSERAFRIAAEESGAKYIMGFEAEALKEYNKFENFRELLNLRIRNEEQMTGKKLTGEDLLLIQMKAIGEYQTNRANQQDWNGSMEQTTQTWISNFTAIEGHPPSTQQIEEYKQQLRFQAANAEELKVILDKEKMLELSKKMTKNEWAILLVMLAGTLGNEFVKDFMPKAH